MLSVIQINVVILAVILLNIILLHGILLNVFCCVINFYIVLLFLI
jgi:hypothetical protein